MGMVQGVTEMWNHLEEALQQMNKEKTGLYPCFGSNSIFFNVKNDRLEIEQLRLFPFGIRRFFVRWENLRLR
jgi:hypothetical protein